MTDRPLDPRVAAAQERAEQRAARYHEVMREVARAAGGRLAGDDGVQIPNSIKDIDSLDQKIRSMSTSGVATTDQALLRVRDMNRYTVLFGEQDYATGVERVRELMAERGFPSDNGKNTWDDPFYQGYHTWFRDQSLPHAGLDPQVAGTSTERHPVEVQIHTPESFAAKSENHDLYKLVRSSELSHRERDAANELQARRNERLTTPPGYERLAERVPSRERPARVSKEALDRVRERLAELRSEPAVERGQPARAPPEHGPAPAPVPGQRGLVGRSGAGLPAPPARELRRLTPERSTGGERGDAGDEGVDRKGLER